MSTINSANIQVGQSITPANNITLSTSNSGDLVVSKGASGALVEITRIKNNGELAYTPAGTGAVPTTVQAALRAGNTHVNQWPGVDPTGATDSTAGIQLALNSGATAVDAKGRYKVGGQLTVPYGVSLLGSGSDTCIFDASGDETGTYADGAVIYKAGNAPVALPALFGNVTGSATTLTTGTATVTANAADDTFSDDAAAGLFTSVQVGDFVTVSGFSNTANNGRFVVTGKTTANLIAVAGALVNETVSATVGVARPGLVFASAHGLSAGDVVMIYNPTDYSYSGARTYYRAGEYCTVATVPSATEVTLEAPLYADYLSAAVQMYRCDYAGGTLSGFSAIAPGVGDNGVVRAVRVRYCRKLTLDDVKASNSDNTSLSISNCYGVYGNVDAHQWTPDTGFGTQYGCIIGNSQDIDLTGTFVGYRHAIAHGGGDSFAVPNRNTKIHDFTASSQGGATGGTHTIDWHGNAEYCSYENGLVTGGGAFLAGNHNRLSRLKIITPLGMVVNAGEMSGLDHVVEDIEAYTGRNDTTRGLINVGGSEVAFDATETTFGGTLAFRNIKIDAPNVTRQAIVIRNRGFVAAPWSVVVDNVEMVAPNATFSTVRIDTVSGNAPARLQVTDTVTISTTNTNAPLALGALDTGVPVRQNAVTGVAAVDTTTAIALIDAAVTFPRAFAKTPSVVATATSQITSADRCAAYAVSPATSGFTARYARVDLAGSNFTAAATKTVSWIASLMEW